MDVRFANDPLPYRAYNVIAVLPGRDSVLRHQYVAIGSHTDHVYFPKPPLMHDSIRIWDEVVRGADGSPWYHEATSTDSARIQAMIVEARKTEPARRDSIWNGADDDASGTVVALEIAEWLAGSKVRPKRSVLFVWHTGEEWGLLGSRWFTDHPTVPLDSIVADLNMDMVGRGGAGDRVGGGPRYLQLVGSRRLSTELGDLVERVNVAGGHNMQFDYTYDADGQDERIYCRSDHANYARFGIPIVFFHSGLHLDYHKITDEPQYIDYTHLRRVALLVKDVAVTVADLDHRPVVDKPKPDPLAECKQ
jgi:hypothetical protein